MLPLLTIALIASYKWRLIFIKRKKNEFVELAKLNYMGTSLQIYLMRAVKQYMFLSISGVIHIFEALISIYIGTYLVVRFGFGSSWLSGRCSCISFGGYMLLIGVSNVIAIKIALKRSLVIISLIANILDLEIASFSGVTHIKLLWWENIYYWFFVKDDFMAKFSYYINYVNFTSLVCDFWVWYLFFSCTCFIYCPKKVIF